MKKKTIAITIFTLCIALFTGCQETSNDAPPFSVEGIALEEGSKEADTAIDPVEQKEEEVIEGYDYVDGREVPIRVRIGIEDILRGEEAYNQLCEQGADIRLPGENEEYIIITLNITYDEGEPEELFMMENRASLEEAGLYFSLPNSEGNADDVTSYLTNNIYNVSILKGQNAQGAIAFLQEKGNVQPLYFVGFENIVDFRIN